MTLLSKYPIYLHILSLLPIIKPFQLIAKQRYKHKLSLPLVPTPHKNIPSRPTATEELMNKLFSWFQGEFDNHPQILQEQKEPPIGHEHIHCTLVPILPTTDSYLHNYLFSNLSVSNKESRFLLAVYYLNGTPSSIFRSRLYHAHPENETVRCIIYDLHTDIKAILKEKAQRTPWVWIDCITHFLENNNDTAYFKELKGCDVLWSTTIHPTRHSYLPPNKTDAIHAIMEQEEVLKPSLLDPTKTLRIKDELSLWKEELWINDRGYDAESGELSYGNALGVPYKMSRVCSFEFCSGVWDNVVLCEDLLWTCGGRYGIDR